MTDTKTHPHVSIVIPVYNEEGILRGSVLELRQKLKPFGFTYEILLCENGSRDGTVEIVICDEIDLCDTEFYARALALLERTDTELVVGSKAMVGSRDERPMVRRLGTQVYNGLLRTVCHYRGTDTHGLKAFKREAMVETVKRCMLDRDVFASEFVIRAHREQKKVVEIPFAVHEKRPPSINLLKRVPHVLKSVARLAVSVRKNEV